MGSTNYKPDIGKIPLGDYYKTVTLVKAQLDMLTGRTTGELQLLASTATTAQIISAINQIINRLNAGSN
jgi:hypothetical protein